MITQDNYYVVHDTAAFNLEEVEFLLRLLHLKEDYCTETERKLCCELIKGFSQLKSNLLTNY